MARQTNDSKKGEILFRKQLTEQQVEGKEVLQDELDADTIVRRLRERMEVTRRMVQGLADAGAVLAPYLEIGAERCQRSMVMENAFGARGLAADISFDMLKSAEYYARLLGQEELPLRVCCDLYNLPIRAGSLPFIFCYETLHHFPDPAPVLRQLHRVLAPGGYFYIKEPFRRALRIPLYKKGKVFSQKMLNRNRLVRFVEDMFAVETCNEEEFGIIENHDITLADWRRALEPFSGHAIDVFSNRFVSSHLHRYRNPLRHLAAYLLGGSVHGHCRKAGETDSGALLREACLICPECLRKNGSENDLRREGERMVCGGCGGAYPVVSGIVLLFTAAQLEDLYPEYAG